MTPTRAQLDEAIAYLVAAVRNDIGAPMWDRPGTQAVLAKLDDQPIAAVAVAAIYAAATRPDQRAPTVIAASGSHWQAFPRHEPTPTPPPLTQEPNNPAPPERAAKYLADLRAALRRTA